jgi:hypothetical protein
LRFDGADAEYVLFDAIRPCGGGDALGVPRAQEQKGNYEQQRDRASGLPAAIGGFQLLDSRGQILNIYL